MEILDFNKEFNKVVEKIDLNDKPNLFLHSCCGPCSTSVLKRAYPYFNVFIIFYNPNIDTSEEYEKRYNELIKFIDNNNLNLKIIYHNYDHSEYLNVIKGKELEKEGGARCEICFRLRLGMAYEITKKYINEFKLENAVNYLTTTLTVSPHKNAKLINEIGTEICKETDINIKYLYSDFKKQDGYLMSIKLSKENNLYRQDYCGCEFAKGHLDAISK